MEVLHVVHGYFPALGGTEFLFQQLSERLVSTYGDPVTVFTLAGYNSSLFVDPTQPTLPCDVDETINGVTVRRFPVNNRIAPHLERWQRRAFEKQWPLNDVLRTLYHGPISWAMFTALLRARADVLAVSAFPFLHMYYPLLARPFNHIPVVLCGALHPGDAWSYDRALIYRAVRACDLYLAYTPFERDHVISQGLEPRRVRIAAPGVDPAPFLTADGAALRQQLGWEAYPVAAFVGQQARHKGVETLYAAMRLVWRQLPTARFIIAGGRTAYSTYLDDILAGFSPQERARIHFINNFDEAEKPAIFAACDVFVSPSGFESFGITFVEAWAAGKPVIGCRSGAIPTVIDEWNDGLLVTYRDAPQLAGALLELLTDPRLCRQMGQRGREKVLAQYTWEIAVARFRQAYQDVAEQKRPRS